MNLIQGSAKAKRYYVKDVPPGKGFYFGEQVYIKIGVGPEFQTTIRRDYKNTQYAYSIKTDRIAVFTPCAAIEGTPFTCEITAYEK